MSKYDYPAGILPDLELFGGDTTPWRINLCHLTGKAYEYEEVEDYGGVLTITPFSMAQGSSVEPIITKTASVEQSPTHDAVLTFPFETSDTLELSGKYVYQIEVSDGTHSRVGQGYLHIKKNNNPNRGGWT